MMNDWQIRPVDSAHELIVEGTVLQDVTSSLSPFKVDDLTTSVSIVRSIATEVITVETGVSGLTASESAQLGVISSVLTVVNNIWGVVNKFLFNGSDHVLSESQNMRGTDGANTVTPDNVSVTAIKTKTDNLPTNPASTEDVYGASVL